MQISLKVGDNIPCDYSGVEAGVLVKLSADGGVETGWLSRKALEDALKVIASLDGQGAPQTAQPLAVAQAMPQMEPGQQPVARRIVATAPANIEVVQNFDRELKSMIMKAEREEPEDGKKKGVREIELRELVMKHKPVFGAGGAQHMFRVMNARLGYERNRFDILWSEKPPRQVDGVEDDE